MTKWCAIGVFCEDIRDEKDGQHTLLGIFPDNMRAPAIPGTFAKLGLYVRIHIAVDEDPGEIKITVRLPDGEIAPLSGFTKDQVQKELITAKSNGMEHSGFMVQAVAGGLPIRKPGRLDLIAEFRGETILCGSMRVFTDNPTSDSTSSPQPASQSPSAS